MATAELVLETAIDALTRLTLVVANLLGELEAEIGEMARTTARRFRSLRRRVRTKRGRETTERDHRGEPRDGHAEQEARHQRDARLERALELSPRWADAARGFQRGRVERRRAGRRAGRAQLSEGLGVDVKLDMRRARAADVVMLARAVGSLVTAGLTPDDARAVVGI